MSLIQSNRTDNKELYNKLQSETEELGENNTCALKSVAVLTDTSLKDICAQSYELGRKKGKGTKTVTTLKLVKQQNYKPLEIDMKLLVALFPKHHRKLAGVTSHHPERFSEQWPQGINFLCRKPGHMWPVKEGKNIDWTEGRACRAVEIWMVIPSNKKITKAANVRGIVRKASMYTFDANAMDDFFDLDERTAIAQEFFAAVEAAL